MAMPTVASGAINLMVGYACFYFRNINNLTFLKKAEVRGLKTLFTKGALSSWTVLYPKIRVRILSQGVSFVTRLASSFECALFA